MGGLGRRGRELSEGFVDGAPPGVENKEGSQKQEKKRGKSG